MSDSIKFSVNLPDDCPPDSSYSARGSVYRIVESNPPTRTSFLTHREKFPTKSFSDECAASGVSVYTDKSDIYRMIRRIGHFRKKPQLIAHGTLNSAMGMLAPAPTSEKSHLTWWVTYGCDAWKTFVVVEVHDPSK